MPSLSPFAQGGQFGVRTEENDGPDVPEVTASADTAAVKIQIKTRRVGAVIE